MNEGIYKWIRIALGVFLVFYGLNQFLHILPTSYGQMPENAQIFIDAVVVYLPILYVFEILLGLLFLLNKWTTLLLIILFPLSVTFMIFLFSNPDIVALWEAIFVAIANVALMYQRKEKYLALVD